MTYEETVKELTEVCAFFFGDDSKIAEGIEEITQCPDEPNRYGGCKHAISLMINIREKLAEKKLLVKLKDVNRKDCKQKRGQYFTDEFLKLVGHLNTAQEYIEADKQYSYDEDGWQYPDGSTYYYANELDHYFTHMVGNIKLKRGVQFGREPGMAEVRNCILKQKKAQNQFG